MRRERLSNWMFRMLCPLLVCFLLLVTVFETAHAQDGNIITLSKAELLVNTRYIPSATAALERRGDTELAALWHQAMAGQPFVQYELVSLEGTGHDVFARYVLVPVEHGGKLLGLIGIDPYTGEFDWRMDRVSAAAELPAPPEQEQLSASVAQYSDSSKTLYPEDVKLVYIEGENYWYIPTTDGDDAEYLLLPLGEDRFSTLDHPGVLAGQDGFVIETDPLPSSPVEQLIILPEASQDQVMGEPEPTMTAVTWMAEAVPYYRQDCKLWCWAASLSMQHQWWSPVRLGPSKAQQSEVVRYVKGRAVCAGGSADDIHRVVKEWHSLDDDYEDFLTTYKGPGKAFAPGSPSGYNNDPKTWLSYMQAPVIAFVDTSRNGKANHAILIVGYDDLDTGGVVYVHDPWYSNWWPGHPGEPCYALALSYSGFDKKWNTTYEGQFFGAYDGRVTSKRRGMVAGIPGDSHFAKVDNTNIQFPGTVRDDEMARIFDLSLGALHDDTAASHDSFGQQYASGILVELADPGQGNIVQPVDTGGFASSSPALPSDRLYLQTHSIPENGNHAGASFHVEPTVLGSIQLRTTWWVYDRDDRWHYDALISVLDDRSGADTSFQMKQPILARDTTGPITNLFQVQDDDTSGPSVTDHTDSGDAEPGTYFFKIRLSDPSDVLDDSEYPRIYLRWNNDEIDAVQHDGYLNADWDGSWYVATKAIGTDRLGQTLYWRTLAYDNDDDRGDDRSAGWSSAYKGGVITQAAPPPPAANVQASDGAHTDKVQVTWDSVSGADYYEVYQATSADGAWVQLGSPSSTRYDDTAAVVGTVYYYSVKACNEAGCSDLSEPDTGYRRGPLPPCMVNLAGMSLVGFAALASISRWARRHEVPVVSAFRKRPDS
jgi:hypothetical protein